MFRANKQALRRMKLEELVAKMEQIEEQSALTLHEYPAGHTIERQRLILAIAKQVKAHLLDQLAAGSREASTGGGVIKVAVVDGREASANGCR